jgi:FKBP-type peptidyl-prolyl cis-trans isomerase FklB
MKHPVIGDSRPPRDIATTHHHCRARQRRWPLGHWVAAALLCTGPWSLAWGADGNRALSAPRDRINYSVGYELGRYLEGLKRQGTGIELEAVFRGVLDALSGAEPALSQAEIRKALDGLSGAITSTDDGVDRVPAGAMPPARARGFVDDFAALNAGREGVVTLPSGVQYEVLRAGAGRSPQIGDRVAVNYQGTLASGVVFDTTHEDGGPMRVRIDEIVVPGLREALLLMKEGDQWRVVVPPSMGFGTSGNNLLRKRDLIYEIELVSVEASQVEAAPGASAQTTAPATGGEAALPPPSQPD